MIYPTYQHSYTGCTISSISIYIYYTYSTIFWTEPSINSSYSWCAHSRLPGELNPLPIDLSRASPSAPQRPLHANLRSEFALLVGEVQLVFSPAFNQICPDWVIVFLKIHDMNMTWTWHEHVQEKDVLLAKSWENSTRLARFFFVWFLVWFLVFRSDINHGRPCQVGRCHASRWVRGHFGRGLFLLRWTKSPAGNGWISWAGKEPERGLDSHGFFPEHFKRDRQEFEKPN